MTTEEIRFELLALDCCRRLVCFLILAFFLIIVFFFNVLPSVA